LSSPVRPSTTIFNTEFKDTNQMNYSTAIFLVNDTVRAVLCSYEPEDGKKHVMFKTMDISVKVDDLVVVPTKTRHGMTVVKVIEVDVNVNYDDPAPMDWIVAKVDRDAHKALVDEETRMLDIIQAADRRKKRATALESATAMADESSDHDYNGPTKPDPVNPGRRLPIPDEAHERFHKSVGDVLGGKIVPAARRQMEDALRRAPPDAPAGSGTTTSKPLPGNIVGLAVAFMLVSVTGALAESCRPGETMRVVIRGDESAPLACPYAGPCYRLTETWHSGSAADTSCLPSEVLNAALDREEEWP
jgi:hypothetical protein